MKWLIFWLLKPPFVLGIWYGMDDRLAAHFGIPALGDIPWILTLGVMFFISLSSEQFSVVRVMEWRK